MPIEIGTGTGTIRDGQRERDRLKILHEVEEGHVNQCEAALQFGLSEREAECLPDWNRWFTKEPANDTDAHRPIGVQAELAGALGQPSLSADRDHLARVLLQSHLSVNKLSRSVRRGPCARVLPVNSNAIALMLWSKLFIPTLRENPAEAEVASHQLLLRAGYIRQLSAGIYSYLFLSQRSLLKIQAIVREEMNAIGGQEVLLPALHPAEIWKESGRWDVMGDNMFRLKDRFQRDLCLGMTHEEVMTVLARGELRSYKQLPQIWYQIQAKFRDEARPKSGLLRVRQFIMKDSYSFDMDHAGLDAAYEKHYRAYCRIFERCGLRYMPVEAHSGAMGGSQSHEFMVASEAGEDYVVMCPACNYSANMEKAVARPAGPAASDPEGDFDPEPFHTPGRKTIAEVAAFTKLPESSQMKSLVLVADGNPVLVLLRGDHQLSETKFGAAVG
ncbi:MAG TPA: proline--tRNA ligase, partial [Bryobacteraceae bacterium]|nr:proline--tRNA ligase [Bryobacteraceae bacterium]